MHDAPVMASAYLLMFLALLTLERIARTPPYFVHFVLDILLPFSYIQPILKRVFIISTTKGGENGCIKPTRFLEEVLEDRDYGGGGGGPH
jgi:hypothetical protein